MAIATTRGTLVDVPKPVRPGLIANSNWTMIDFPFNKFKHNFLNNLTLEGKNIKTFGIVAYGRDYISDVSVSKITFYY